MVENIGKEMTVRRLAELCGARLANESSDFESKVIRNVASLDGADDESVTWVSSAKLAEQLGRTRAGAILGTEELVGSLGNGLVVKDPDSAIASVLEAFYVANEPPSPGVHPTAIVDPSCVVAEDARIGAYAIVGRRCRIGAGSIIHEGVSIGAGTLIGEQTQIYDRVVIYDHCEIGSRVTLHAGVVIGGDGFGYIHRDGRHRKLMHLGNVVIEDDVEIGPNSCIDRGKFGPTRIGRGTKIDNLVMIAHNVQIGPMCILVAQCGIAGSARLGPGVMVGGQAGVRDGVTIGTQALIAAQAGAMADVPEKTSVVGSPAKPQMSFFREVTAVQGLPQLLKKVAALEKRVQELEAAAND